MARNFFGTERLLFGTDFPFGPPDGSWAVDEKDALEAFDISAADREAIFHGNAERMLGLAR